MLLVEVVVPSQGKRCDFELEESVPVQVLVKEMVAVLCQKEYGQSSQGKGGFSLYSQELQQRLAPSGTLQENGIKNGQRLILL